MVVLLVQAVYFAEQRLGTKRTFWHNLCSAARVKIEFGPLHLIIFRQQRAAGLLGRDNVRPPAPTDGILPSPSTHQHASGGAKSIFGTLKLNPINGPCDGTTIASRPRWKAAFYFFLQTFCANTRVYSQTFCRGEKVFESNLTAKWRARRPLLMATLRRAALWFPCDLCDALTMRACQGLLTTDKKSRLRICHSPLKLLAVWLWNDFLLPSRRLQLRPLPQWQIHAALQVLTSINWCKKMRNVHKRFQLNMKNNIPTHYV